jgi:hypothetical protein
MITLNLAPFADTLVTMWPAVLFEDRTQVTKDGSRGI